MIDRDRMHTLKEINLDAARYRWARENMEFLVWEFVDKIGLGDDLHAEVDSYIDKKLSDE